MKRSISVISLTLSFRFFVVGIRLISVFALECEMIHVFVFPGSTVL